MRVDPAKLEKVLMKNRMNWSTLAERSKVSPVTLYYMRKGVIKKNHFGVIYKISDTLGVEPEEILE